MSTEVRWRHGTTVEHSAFTGAQNEITVDTTKKVAVVHDGVTVGGFPLARADQVANDLTSYAKLLNPVFTGDPQAPTASTDDNDTSIATTAFVKNQGYATLANPVFTGNPQAPTAALGTNTAQVATTAFVQSALPNLTLRGHIDGLVLSTAGASTTITTSIGEATDSTVSVLMKLVSPLAKTTATWAVGNTSGGKFSAAALANNTHYHFFLIRRPDTGVVDVGFDVSATSPTLPTNYTQFRRIFSWPTNGSGQWATGIQDADFFQYNTPPTDVSAIPGAATLRTLSVPKGINVIVRLGFQIQNVNGSLGFSQHWDPALGATAPTNTIGSNGVFVNTPVNQLQTNTIDVRTNTSAQIYNQGSGGITSYLLQTLAWFDHRGRDA